MKKILSIVLLVALCLGLLAGCGETATNTGLEDAKTFVHSSYIANSANTPVDYKVMGVARVDGVEYKIEWTANSDKITFTRGEDKFVTVHVPTDNLEDVKYTLTGTISDAEGKTATVTFERVVPARAGIPTEVTTGTYVITWETTTFSSLTADKNYGYAPFNTVTVADGTVTGHFKADVLTLTAVDGGFTIQDAHGRYVYLKGTYNSFNVSADAPEEGHIWQLLTGKDGSFIVNKMNGKTLCFDSAYSSWGAYDEVTEARKSQITVTAATAPEVDPETPDQPETPDTPSQPSNGEITTPVAGTAYKLGMFQGNKNVMLYFTGLINQASTPWYMKSTENVAEAIDVYVEEVDGGLLLYFTIEGTKTYLDMHKDGTHYSLQLTTEPVSVYTWNAEHNTFVATVDDKDCFIGTSGTYNTFSCNNMDKVASSFIAHLYPQTGAVTPSEPETPDTPDTPSTPAEVIIADGSYVLVVDGKGMTALAADKGYGYMPTVDITVANGVATGYTDNEIIVIKNVDGGFTMQDCYGRYIYMSGTYNNFNVSADMPAEGHIWTATATEGGYIITNVLKGKNLVYGDGGYTTFGAYADKSSVVSVIALSTSSVPGTLAEQIAEANKLNNKEYLEYESTITGTITDEPAVGKYDATQFKFTVSDGTNSILCYYVTIANGTPKKGDTITVTGKLTAYNGSAQFDSTATGTLAGGSETPDTPAEPEKPEEPETPATDADAIISFADASSRTEMSADKQVWSANGMTVTNDKAASTSDVKDYVGPVRFYAKTSLTIAYTGMKTIKITCNRDSDVTNLVDSLAAVSGITVSSEGKVVTVTFAAASDVLVIDSLVAQVRVDKIEIFK